MSCFKFLNARLLSAIATLALSLPSSIDISQAQTGSDPATNAQPSFRFETNLVIVRVVVRDSSGNPVTGLNRDDFRLFDQGKEQAISQFEEEPSTHAPGSTVAVTPSRSTESSGALRPRFIAFYFDNLNASDAELMQARDAADRYLADSLQPNDRVALFSSEKVLSDFTSDHEKIHQALMQLRASIPGPPRQHLCPDLSNYQALQLLSDDDPQSDAWKVAWAEGQACPVKAFNSSSAPGANGPDRSFIVAIRQLAQAIVDRNQERTRTSLQQIGKVVELTAPAPGDRSVVLVSHGFLSQSEQQSLDRIVDRALRAGVVINALDPRGLAILARESDASQSTTVVADPRATQAGASLDRSSAFVTADVLVELAHGTGGQFFHNDNDLRAGFKALSADVPHYILAFSPKNVKLDGKFHALKVSLAEKHKGYAIQARRGYFASPDSGRQIQLDTNLKKPTDSTLAPPQIQAVAVAGLDRSLPSASTAAASLSAQPAKSAGKESVAAGESAAISRARVVPIHLRPGVNRVTASQLQQLVAAASGKSDTYLAKQFAGMELTERISLPDLTRLDTTVPGNQARGALLLLTDAAAFLKPPEPAVLLPPTPTVDEQIRCLKAAASYTVNTMGKLPNFFATRSATVFADSPAHMDQTTMFPYEPLHRIDQSKATVLFRDGKETLDRGEDKSVNPGTAMGLVTAGEFGQLLGIVFADASRSSLSWSHWERAESGPVSVYRYAVPKDKSHYRVEFCCTGGTSGMGRFQQISGYHGEISVDPVSGAVLRLTLLADFKSDYPMIQADMMVEYGPVEIGGKTYICPLHSVSIAKAYTKAPPSTLDTSVSDITIDNNRNSWPQQTMINDVEFGQYHVFRSDSRIVPNSD